MTTDIKLNLLANKKEESRKIVKEIINFGVTDDQKIDIMYLLAINLEDNEKMKEVTNFLKSYRETINKNEENNYTTTTSKKILT